MKKNWLTALVSVLVLAGMVVGGVLSCDNGGGGSKGSSVVATYTGTDNTGLEYTLNIKTPYYELLIDDESVSTGIAVEIDGKWYLIQNNAPENVDALEVTVDSSNKITAFDGIIYPDDDSSPITPGKMVAVEPVAGVWGWVVTDDSQPNGSFMDPQTVFAPGGSSRIPNAKEDSSEKDKYGQNIKRPFVYTTPQTDNDGKPITDPVYNFTGVTKVSSAGRAATSGAQFPLVGWEAVPDAATLELLKTAYGYSFWVRLNSGTADNWAFLTAVVTDFAEEKGYEYKHYFGNQAGDSGGNAKVNNFTGGLALNKWHKITVVMDKSAANMEQDKWIWTYNPEYKGPFTQSKAKKIQWQIPLQHQVGAGVKARSGTPYDITDGEYSFNVDFYGLTLISK